MSARQQYRDDVFEVDSSAIGQSWAIYALLVLFVTELVGYLDRQVLSLLVQPIKASLALSDGQIGLMQGTAFILTFSVASLFMGRLADRHNRRNIIVGSVLIWTISAAAGALAHNGIELFVSRMGVGVGEAGLYPAAFSMISDSFKPTNRGKALGFLNMGVFAGAGLSLSVVAFFLPSIAEFSIALAHRGTYIEPWRLVLASMLMPGLVCCGLLFTLREPGREVDKASARLAPAGIRVWLDNAQLFLPHHIGIGLNTFCAYALNGWAPTMLIREYGYSARDAGIVCGVMVFATGCSCSWLGGWLGDHRARIGGAHARLQVAIYGVFTVAAGCLLMFFSHSSMWLIGGTSIAMAGTVVSMITGVLSL